MNTTAFHTALHNPDTAWNLTALTSEQRRAVSRFADNAERVAGAVEALCTGYAEWRKASAREAASAKAKATRAANKAAAGK